MICVDANILIAALDADDPFHLAVSATLVDESDVFALNVTWAEALIHPQRLGRADEARSLLDQYGVIARVVTDEIAWTACELRAEHGNRNFPMLDALVVAAGIEAGVPIVTTDAKWPAIPGADVRLVG